MARVLWMAPRDLKPDNILLTEEGKVKLNDTGSSKVISGALALGSWIALDDLALVPLAVCNCSQSKTFSFLGAPDYMAPEMVLRAGHTHAVDWWVLGLLSYLMAGAQRDEVKPCWYLGLSLQGSLHSSRKSDGDLGKAACLARLLCSSGRGTPHLDLVSVVSDVGKSRKNPIRASILAMLIKGSQRV